jgi:hypothetical protein
VCRLFLFARWMIVMIVNEDIEAIIQRGEEHRMAEFER